MTLARLSPSSLGCNELSLVDGATDLLTSPVLASAGSDRSRGEPVATPPSDGEVWHVLQYSDVLDLELSMELAELAPTFLWEPDRSVLPVRPRFQETERRIFGSRLRIRSFPLMRGYARSPWSSMARTGPALAARLARRSASPKEATLVCTTPYFAPVAERWQGPVVYWLTDLMARYEGVDPALLRELDVRMCRVADLVCPASERLASYLREEAGCAAEKIELLPNATRAANILPVPLTAPAPLPEGERPWTGPVAGVIGNLADNMDWVFLQELLQLTPWLHWAFVGPTSRPAEDAEQARARDAVMRHPQTRFLGFRPYGELCQYARALTVAVLPYRRREPTYSGSSTRFYEHLAAGHPILATPGVAELLEKTPLLTVVGTPAAAAAALEALRAADFDDGQRTLRWEASRGSTWKARAATMRSALAERLAEQEVGSRK